MANRKLVLRFTGTSPFKIAEQVKPGLRDGCGLLVPEAAGSWMVDEILFRANVLRTVTSISIIEYMAIPYKKVLTSFVPKLNGNALSAVTNGRYT